MLTWGRERKAALHPAVALDGDFDLRAALKEGQILELRWGDGRRDLRRNRLLERRQLGEDRLLRRGCLVDILRLDVLLQLVDARVDARERGGCGGASG